MSSTSKSEVSFPTRLEDITLEWLNKTLSLHNLEVEEFSLAGDAKEGRGALSDLVRINLQVRMRGSGDGMLMTASERKSTIVKSLPADPQVREYTVSHGYFPCELQMYTKILPALKDFLDRRGVSPQNRFQAPICYFGAEEGKDTSDYKFILIMEDLMDSGYKLWADGPRKSFDFDHTLVAVKEIALLHATALAYKLGEGIHLFADVFPNFARHNVTEPALDHFIKTGFATTRELVSDESLAKEDPLPTGILELLNELEVRFKEIVVKDILTINPENLNTLRHTDLHCFNVAFRYDEAGSPVGAKWFDFQNANEGRPAMDLAFFLILNCESEFSSERLKEILSFYYSTFMGVLKEAKVDLDYPFEKLQEDFSHLRLASILHVISGAPVWCCNEISKRRLRKAIIYAYKIGVGMEA